MALFRKKEKDSDVIPAVSTKTATAKDKVVRAKDTKVVSVKKMISPVLVPDRDLASVIVKPRITEKAAISIDKNVYVFEIRSDATKRVVRDAIKALYSVTPVKVNIVNMKPRHYVSKMRGRSMTEHGLKKAYVYLKKGDRIDLV